MGCSSSTNVHPSIYNESIRKQEVTNGNLKPKLPPKCVNEKSIRGDYTQYQLAKHNREKQQKDRQIKIFIAADEMSGKMMEDREMLSLGTRSRGTSRNTSRATSPNNNRRSIQFKDEQVNPMTPVAEDKLSRGASLRSLEYGTDKENSSPKRKQKTRKHSKTKSKNKKLKKDKKSKKGKEKALKEMNESENDEPDSGLEDEDENDDYNNESVNLVNGETVDKDAVVVKSEHEINRNGEEIVETIDASTSVLSKRSVNDIAMHSASEDSGIAGTGLNAADSSENGGASKTNVKPTADDIT